MSLKLNAGCQSLFVSMLPHKSHRVLTFVYCLAFNKIGTSIENQSLLISALSKPLVAVLPTDVAATNQ